MYNKLKMIAHEDIGLTFTVTDGESTPIQSRRDSGDACARDFNGPVVPSVDIRPANAS